jgi:gamma-glutamyltranspeptidase/glutathione hydrolase
MSVAVALVAVAATAGHAIAAGARGDSGAVAAEHRLASEAGLEMLRAGGNAVDAAVAALLVGGVVNPSSSGLGGGGFMLHYRAAQGSLHAIDFRETAPARATRNMFLVDGKLDEEGAKRGGMAVAVPAEAQGLAYALAEFGTMTLAEVSAPARRLARDGFAVESHLATALARHRDAIAADRELSRYFVHEDGSSHREGEILRRPDLAETLETLARDGAAAFTHGALAADIVAAVRRSGGILESSDLAGYRVVEREPVVTTYRGLRVAGMPPPSAGGGTIATALEVLEAYRLKDLGDGSSTYFHLVAETLKAVFADRALYYGDPAFTSVPLARLTSPEHAVAIRRRFSATRAIPASEYGTGTGPRDLGTAHVSVVDSRGNAVASTSSINTAFGAKLGVRGFVLNNTMDDFSLRPGTANAYGLVGNEANAIRGGKRPVSSMSPTLVLDGSGVRVVAGGSGGPLIISATLQALLGTIDFGLGAEAAVAATRVHHQWLPDALMTEEGVSAETRASLRRRGHDVRSLPIHGALSVVTRTRSNGALSIEAGSDDRKGGVPAAY